VSLSFTNKFPLTRPFSEKDLKRLFGKNNIEDPLKRLDRLTQEEARMAAAESLKVVNTIDNRVAGIDDRVAGVDERVAGVDDRVKDVDDKVCAVDDKVCAVDDKVCAVDDKLVVVIDGAQSISNQLSKVVNP